MPTRIREDEALTGEHSEPKGRLSRRRKEERRKVKWGFRDRGFEGIRSPKAENVAEKVGVLVRTEAPSLISATAPRGRGCVMIPTIVARKIASSCHALWETPFGTGTNHRITPVAIEAVRGLIATPCHGAGEGGDLRERGSKLRVLLKLLSARGPTRSLMGRAVTYRTF